MTMRVVRLDTCFPPSANHKLLPGVMSSLATDCFYNTVSHIKSPTGSYCTYDIVIPFIMFSQIFLRSDVSVVINVTLLLKMLNSTYNVNYILYTLLTIIKYHVFQF